MLPHGGLLEDRYSEREEKRIKGKLLTQAEKEEEKDKAKKEIAELHKAHDGSK